MVHLTRGGYAIYNAAREDPAASVPRLLRTLDMEVSSIMKGGYDHYMQKEIHEQPESILQTMRGRVKFSRVVPKVGRSSLTDLTARWLVLLNPRVAPPKDRMLLPRLVQQVCLLRQECLA